MGLRCSRVAIATQLQGDGSTDAARGSRPSATRLMFGYLTALRGPISSNCIWRIGWRKY